MAGIRVEKFERQMLRDLGELFQLKSRDWFGGAFISVSRVNSSPDLGFLKCYVSIHQSADANKTMQSIQDMSKQLRMELAKRNKHLRKTPEIIYLLDDSLDYVSKMDALFAQINKDKKTSE